MKDIFSARQLLKFRYSLHVRERSWTNRVLLSFTLLTSGPEANCEDPSLYDRKHETGMPFKLVCNSFNSLMPSHSPNSKTMSEFEKTVTIDSSILPGQYSRFPETLSPGGNTSDESGGSPRPLDRTVPPNHEHRTLILCFDGTGMWAFT